MATKRFGILRLCSAVLILAMVFGLCGVFAVPVKAADGGMTEDPQIINPSITTTIRNITEDEVEKYILAFSNGNTDRVDGTNSVDGTYGGSLDASPPTMLKTLSASGYPQIKIDTDKGIVLNDRHESISAMNSKYDGSNSLEPIFNDPSKTYTAENSPFNYDASTQNYSLDSKRNHVYFDTSTKKFTIYNEPLRPYNITPSYDYDTFGAFLPFNSTEGTIRITDASGKPAAGVPSDITFRDGESYAANLHVTPKSGTNMADNWFVMKVEFSFYIPKDGQINGKDMVFKFSGDDDVWVYIDDVLVVDQGGTHKHTQSSINFATGDVEYQHYHDIDAVKPTDENSRDYKDWPWPWTETKIKDCFEQAGVESKFKGDTLADFTVHTLTFFFMERGGEASNCKLDFNLPIVPKGALSVQKTLDGIVTKEAENKQYTFILKDKDGNALSNTEYSVIQTDGTLKSGTTENNGQFKLKANERAVFEKIEGGEDYSVVQVTEKDDEVYNDYSRETKCTINGTASGSEGEDGYSTGNFEVKYHKDNQTDIVFTNIMKQDKELIIKKTIGDYISADEVFSFEAEIEGVAEPVTFTLKGGHQYTITDIPAGADVKITEKVPESMNAESTVSGSDITGSGVIEIDNITAAKTYVNYLNEIKLVNVTVEKIIDGSLGNRNKEFEITVDVEFEDYSDDVVKTHTFKLSNNGTKTIEGIPYGANVTVSENAEDYTPTLTVGNTTSEGKKEWEIQEITSDKKITFKNVKDGSPNTGISLDSLPYIVLLILVIAGGAAFTVRRRKIDCEL